MIGVPVKKLRSVKDNREAARLGQIEAVVFHRFFEFCLPRLAIADFIYQLYQLTNFFRIGHLVD